MNTLKIVFVLSLLFQTPLVGGVGIDLLPPPPPVYVEENPLFQKLNASSDEEIRALLLQEVQEKGMKQVILGLNQKLSLSDMKSLFAILNKEAATEALAEKLWKFIQQKAKIETISDCNPRIMTIVKSKQTPTQFWVGLSDGTSWQVEPYHMGGDDPAMQEIMINSLLGDCVQVYDNLFEVTPFPDGGPASLMHVQKIEQGMNLEGNDVYFLGWGGFVNDLFMNH